MKTLKKTLCLVLAVVMALSLFAVAASAKSLSEYSDASDVKAEYKVAVDYASQLGILEGVSTTSDVYRANGTLTRAQLATMIYRMVTGDVAKKYVANYAGGTAFSDVKSADWFAGYVNYAADAGYLAGVGNGKYSPNNSLTGYQTLAAFLRALGYGKNGEFEGKDWITGVMKYASVIDGDIVADWSKPISRQVAAQLIFNTMSADMVVWNEFTKSYNKVWAAKNTLAETVFDITDTPVAAATDIYGNPVAAWNSLTTGKTVVEVALDCIKTYTTKVDGCTLLKDLGYAETNVTPVKTVTVMFGFDGLEPDVTLTHTANGSDCAKKSIGGQGVVTRLYKIGTDKFVAVRVDTFLAKVNAVTPASHGVEATTLLDVYTQGWSGQSGEYIQKTVKGASYAKDTYVLVTYTSTNNTWSIVGVPTTKTAKLTTIDKTNSTSAVDSDAWVWTIDGVGSFKASEHWNYLYSNNGTDAAPALGTNYVWFFDAYGNIIGCVDPIAAPSTYAVVDGIVWVNDGLNDGKAIANIYTMDGKLLDGGAVTVVKVDGKTVANTDAAADYSTAKVSDNKALNTAYTPWLYKLDKVAGGYTLTKAGWNFTNMITLKETLTKGDPSFGFTGNGVMPTASSSTVYLLKYLDANGKVAYASYKGYENMPSVEGAVLKLEFVANTHYVAYAFVDVTNGGKITDTVANTINAFVTSTTDVKSVEKLDALGTKHVEYQYTVYVDGAATTVKTLDKTLAEFGVEANKVWALTADSTGYIVKAAEGKFADKAFTAVSAAADTTVAADKTSMVIDGVQYNTIATSVYVVKDGVVAKKAMSDLTAETFDSANAIIAADGAVLLAIYVF